MGIPSVIKIKSESKGLMKIVIPAGSKITNNEVYLICPICTPSRKPQHQKEKKFSFNVHNQMWRCKHCGEAGHILTDQDYDKIYVKPLNHKVDLTKFIETDPQIEWFRQRGISEKTVQYLKIQKAKKVFRIKNHENPDMIGKLQKRTCIGFPFEYNGQLINVQYRDKLKNFTMESNADLVFYNIDNIDKNGKYVVITEGLIDTASYIESGITQVVSVPNGVTLSENEKTEFEKTGTFENLGNINLKYVTKCYDDFENFEFIIIATDADAAGIKLRLELAKRFGKERCKFIDFKKIKKRNGEPSKDANDVLIDHGTATLRETIDTAQFFPNEEIFDIENEFDSLLEQFDVPTTPGTMIGAAGLDYKFSVRMGHFVVLNGFPNHGKTTFALWLAMVATLHPALKMRWGIYSPENYPIKMIIDSLVEIFLGNIIDKKIDNHITKSQYRDALQFIKNKFYFIDREEGYTPSDLRKVCKNLIQRYGLNGFIKDPWNSLLEDLKPGQSEYKWLVQELSAEQRFATRNNVYNLVLAHPITIRGNKDRETDTTKHPTIMDLEGGKIWWSKVYDGLCIHRADINDVNNLTSEIYVQKIKFQKLCGIPNYDKNPVLFKFKRRSNRFLDENGEDLIQKLIQSEANRQKIIEFDSDDFIEETIVNSNK